MLKSITLQKITGYCSVLMLVWVVACSNLATTTTPRKQLIDSDWKFHLGAVAEANQQTYNDTDWRTLSLPHDWSIEGKPDHNNPMGMEGGFFPAGLGWYRKTITIPETDKDKQISLYFEGVYMNSEVFVNGTSLGVYPYGYSSFMYDVTPHLKFGQENTIAVKVDNSQQVNCRWYTGSGMYRHVWLVTKNPVHLAHWGVAVTTPTVSKAKATVQLVSTVENTLETPVTIALQTKIEKDTTTVSQQTSEEVVLAPHSKKEVTQQITIDNPKLWTPDTPQLYKAIVSVIEEGVNIDTAQETFGIRTIEYTAEKGFLLNGQPTLLNGGCVHHDNGPLGAAAYDKAEERKVALLKEAGFNAVRTSHNIPSEAFLRACDTQGLLVIDEAFDGWRESKTPHDYSNYIDEWWQKDLDAMVKRDRNHPSVIMWSIGNEIIERTKPEAITTGTMLADYVRSVDATRPVTSAMTSWGQGWARFDSLFAVHDVGGYNYQLHHAEEDHERVPSRVIVQTESYPKDAFYVWNQSQQHPYIIGDFVWTAMDYLGESSIGRYYYPGEPDGQHFQGDFWPWHGAYCGDIDLTGWRKPISHYRSLLWNNDTPVYMAVKEPSPATGSIKTTDWAVWPTWESWTWPGHEGKPIEVEVYSKHPAVRLYLNNQLVAEKQVSIATEFKATFTIPYTKGTLKAVAVEANTEIGEATLTTANKVAAIQLVADKTTLQAQQQDLSFITVNLVDANGVLNPNAEEEITFSIEGPGTIIGVANANLQDTDAYVGTSRKTWKGKAMVIVKANQAGTIQVTAKIAKLPATNIALEVVE